MQTEKTYWVKAKGGVKYITEDEDFTTPTVFGALSALIYDHCNAQIRGQKGKTAREITVTITG